MQGFNMGRYVPPDVEGTASGNALHRKRPPGMPSGRDGAQTVRFEMPFAIWCLTCPKPTIIGQGVRFNASKRRDGSYHSTPIWRFGMRHADCGGAIEIRTDPQNTAYVVLSGARRRDTGTDADGQAAAEPVLTDAERDVLRRSAFASLEKTIEDREQLAAARTRIDALAADADRHWADPYARNQRLRTAFRAGRHQRERDAADTDALKDRMSLGIDLLPASEDDARRARLVDFGETGGGDGGVAAADKMALAKPLFAAKNTASASKSKTDTSHARLGKSVSKPGATPKLKAEKKAAQSRDSFVSAVMGNTRAAQDPFLNGSRVAEAKGPARLPGVKRKRSSREHGDEPAFKAAVVDKAAAAAGKADVADKPAETVENAGAAPNLLVDYGSD
jgi:coiled-coil domain-containing protein 130